MSESVEVCRICSAQVKLEGMERHVRLCQKKCQLRQAVEEKAAAIGGLLEELKAEFQLISDKAERSEEEEELRRVAKLLLCSEKKKERKAVRRSSLAGVRSEKSFRDRFEELIEEYEYDHGHHFILHRILEDSRQKGYLEKRLNALEVAALNSDHCDSDSHSRLEEEDLAAEDGATGAAEAK